MKPLNWAVVTVYAIHKEGVWFSGRVMDVLVRDQAIILGMNFGGVWVVDTSKSVLEGFSTTCLTDAWDDPNVYSLAHGPDHDAQVYAGCEKTLWYFKLSNSNAMGTSAIISLPVSDPLTIYRILVQKEARRIILATGTGLWWSSIPSNPAHASEYAWKKATGLPGDKIAGLCPAGDQAIHAAVWGDGITTGDNYGIFRGVFESGNLSFTRSKLHWKDGNDKHDMARISLASCAGNSSVAFAAVSKVDKDFRGVLQYDEAHDQWNDILNQQHFAGTGRTKQPGSQGTFNNAIAVAPDNSSIVALGWQMGTFIFSNNTWKMLEDDKSHHDVHGLLFTKVENGKHTLYIGSDGGILKVSAPAQEHPSFDDRLNVFLPTLLFKDELRRAYATVDTSPLVDGLIAGGLQDNGCKYLKTDVGKYTPWLQIMRNDGGTNTFLANGILLSRESNKTSKFSSFAWNTSLNNFDASMSIPCDVQVKDVPLMDICTRIPAPAFTNGKHQLMHAISGAVQDKDGGRTKAGDNILLGLFADSENALQFHWEVIGVMPDLVTAAASADGNFVFVATKDGKVSLLSTAKYLNKEHDFFIDMPMPEQLKKLKGSILQFDLQQPPLVFALFVEKDNTGTAIQGHILVYNGSAWKEIFTPVKEVIYSIAADWGNKPTVFVHEDNRLFFVTDDAVYQGVQSTGPQLPGFQTSFNWVKSIDGLPSRPHGSHLRTGWDGKKLFLYLSTYGRSVYRAELREVFPLPGQGKG
jgi:hypothetical protein